MIKKTGHDCGTLWCVLDTWLHRYRIHVEPICRRHDRDQANTIKRG